MRLTQTRLQLLETLQVGGIGAELGVFEGVFSKDILRIAQPRTLYLVDMFEGIINSGDQNGAGIHSADMHRMFQVLTDKFAADNSVKVVKSCSYEWLRGVPRGSLDWIYIDTDHAYGTTIAELLAARLAVKPGGIIAGHDYATQFPGVIQAVTEFCAALGLERMVYEGDVYPSYRIINC